MSDPQRMAALAFDPPLVLPTAVATGTDRAQHRACPPVPSAGSGGGGLRSRQAGALATADFSGVEATQAQALRTLLEERQVAALATLHEGEPAQSMVPYALLPAGRGFVIHVSRLATHTTDMLVHPAVSLLVIAADESTATAQELPRASVKGLAKPCPPDATAYPEARALYLARFPTSEPMFGFADFSVFIVEPRSVRFVGGFARATSASATEFAAVMSGVS